MRRHTLIAGLVIACFVALQAILFFSNYTATGPARTEAEAIAHARKACPVVDEFGPMNWHASLVGNRWIAHAELRHTDYVSLRERFDGGAEVAFDSRDGSLIDCRTVGDDAGM
jgi:hypothetical protein